MERMRECAAECAEGIAFSRPGAAQQASATEGRAGRAMEQEDGDEVASEGDEDWARGGGRERGM